MLDQSLEAAYRNTDYWVSDAPEGPVLIRVGEVSIDLEELLYEEVATEWAYVTACNPRSNRLADDENAERMRELEWLVRERGLRHYHGEGADPDGRWPPEPSLLILGIIEMDAIELARQFGQNAIVVGQLGEPARLVWIDYDSSSS